MSNLTLFDIGDPQWDGGGRDPLDRYYTPTWATQALVDYLGERLHGSVWEPACGADWIGRVLRASGRLERYTGTDLDPDSTRTLWAKEKAPYKQPGAQADFLSLPASRISSITSTVSNDWIITNPPYATPTGSATDFARRALEYRAKLGLSVAMLMRIGWLEPCADRIDILTGNPPTDVLVLPRVHYINAGNSNNQTSAWYIWDGDFVHTKLTIVGPQ